METKNILIVAFLIVLAFVFFGFALPAMISSSNSAVVVGGFLVIFGMVVGAVIVVNSWFQRRK
jgi:hypothetical protein